MKKLKYFILPVFISFLTLLSCEDHPVLDTKPGDAYTEADVYSDITLAEPLVFYSYNALDGWGMNKLEWWSRRMSYENLADEGFFHFKFARYNVFRFLYPDQNPTADNMGIGFINIWELTYRHIRLIDLFFSKIDDSPIMQSDIEDTQKRAKHLKGEMAYLRATSYTRLINLFGGVPYIKEVFELSPDSGAYDMKRDSYQYCVESIVSDLDEAINLLPDHGDPLYRTATHAGRITKQAAHALKSRVLLYAASKLHDPTTIPNGPLYDYDVSSKWEDARDAAKAAIESAEANGITLPQTGDNWQAYQKMFVETSSELIQGRYYDAQWGATGAESGEGSGIKSLPDFTQGPSGDGFYMITHPGHNFVSRFKRTDGTYWDHDVIDTANMYLDRDPRFYANFLFNGCDFKGREIEFWSPFGFDSRDWPSAQGWHGTKTGYGLRKFQDESLSTEDAKVVPSVKRPYPIARLSELYLNYAEALYHTGDEANARLYVNRITSRVNMPAITSSGDELLQAIKDERAIELCYEGQRFFDLRRWMDTDVLNEDISGIRWERHDANTDTLNANGYLVGIINGEIATVGDPDVLPDVRTFNDNMYYLPIPDQEIRKVSALQQNYGW